MTEKAPSGAGGFDISRAWTDERVRGVIFQIALVLGVAGLAAFIVDNTIANYEEAGLSFGYGFLFDTANFDINQRLIEYASTSTYGRALGVGALNTILVAVMGVAAATLIGFVTGVLRLSNNFLGEPDRRGLGRVHPQRPGPAADHLLVADHAGAAEGSRQPLARRDGLSQPTAACACPRRSSRTARRSC